MELAIAVLRPKPSRAEREARERQRAKETVASCLAQVAAASGVDAQHVREPDHAPKAVQRKARVARQVLVLWLRNEHQILARHICTELGLTTSVPYGLVRAAERRLGALLWAVELLASKPAPLDRAEHAA